MRRSQASALEASEYSGRDAVAVGDDEQRNESWRVFQTAPLASAVVNTGI
jgi:hypothetical protein